MSLHRQHHRVARALAVAASSLTLMGMLSPTSASAAEARLTTAQLKTLVSGVSFAPAGWYASPRRATGRIHSRHHWCGTLQPLFREGSTWASRKGSALGIEVDQQTGPAQAKAAYDAIARLKFTCPHVMVSTARGLPRNILDIGLVAGDGSLDEELVTVQGSALLWAETRYRGPWTPSVTRNNHAALHALATAYRTAAHRHMTS